jgi:hypothetical protein
MSVFSRIKTWTSEVLTASDLNAEFDNIITHMAPDGIEDASENATAMQETADPGGVGTESLATDLLGEIKRLRYVIKRLVGAQWYTNPGRSLAANSLAVQTGDIAASAVTTAKIADSNVTTAKIADSNVTPAKINLGAQISSSSGGTGFTSNTSATDVNNLSVAFTASGTKNVMIEIVPDGTNNYSYMYFTRQGETGGMDILLLRDSTTVGKLILQETNTNSGGYTGIQIPAYAKFLDASPAAGSYTYKIQILNRSSGASPACGILYAKLLVYEL